MYHTRIQLRHPIGRRRVVAAWVAITAGWLVSSASALVVHHSGFVNDTSTPSAFTVAPPVNPGWENVGWGSNGVAASDAGSAIYVGNRWVLTANHTKGNRITLGETFGGGNTFTIDPATPGVRLRNPAGLKLSNGTDATGFTDLYMFRLPEDPRLAGLATLDIIQNTPSVNDSVVMIGTGVERGSERKTFPGGTLVGYEWSATSRPKVWGENTVAGDQNGNTGFVFNNLGATVSTFGTLFDNVAGRSEAQASNKDSGGAVFVDVTGNGDWQLGGVIVALSGPLNPQPNQVSVLGNSNGTFAVDLSVYRDQILTIRAVPEPSSVMILTGLGWVLSRRPRRRTSNR